MIAVIIGPSGAGKTTVGRVLAAELEWRFLDADDLHPPDNIAKMREGKGLSAEDREPWLRAVRTEIDAARATGESLVVACSALKEEHRALLGAGLPDVRFAYLRADPEVLADRLRERTGHFAGPTLLPSQLATLEEPDDSIAKFDASSPPPAIAAAIRLRWAL